MHMKSGQKLLNNTRNIRLFSLTVVLMLARMAFALDNGTNPSAAGAPRRTPPAQTGQTVVADQKNGLAEMREWLELRNKDRKQKGISADGNFNSIKQYPYPLSRLTEHPRQESPTMGGGAHQASPVMLAPQTGRGPDGRIHHRLIINEEGPDQLQVYTATGYAAPAAASEDATKLARLTPRGREVWVAGAYLRNPSSYYALKPKGWNHPK